MKVTSISTLWGENGSWISIMFTSLWRIIKAADIGDGKSKFRIDINIIPIFIEANFVNNSRPKETP